MVEGQLNEFKYDGLAARWSAHAYARPQLVYERRARLVLTLGVPLTAGDRVLEVGCADGGLAERLLDAGLRVDGLDQSPQMIERARERLGARVGLTVGDLRTYVPQHAVTATVGFRVLPYLVDRPAFFRRLAEFTERKMIFDFRPVQMPADTLRAEVAAAGFTHFTWRPWLLASKLPLPRVMVPVLEVAETRLRFLSDPLVGRHFSAVFAAWR